MWLTNTNRRSGTAVALAMGSVLGLAQSPTSADADDNGPDTAIESDDLNQVLAAVDGVPVQLGEVRQELQAVLSGRRTDAVEAEDARLVREMLQQIVRRRLALAALSADGRAASDSVVERALGLHRDQFEQRGESFDDYLNHNGVPIESYRRRIAWELSWAAYKEAMLTDENLEQFFERYRRHFDGTEVQASHVLFRSEGPAGEGVRSAEFGVRNEEPGGVRSEETDSLNSELRTPNSELERAREIRAAIEAGKLTFADAAAKFSDAPSKDRGGDIGYFPRRGVMHEAFAAAAFALKAGEISEPIVTPFGVHLIQVTGEKPGSKKLAEVREEVYRAAEARLFHTLVAGGRKRAKVEYAAP
jgi:parvulin-like peptidyl-prolyl isomerase